MAEPMKPARMPMVSIALGLVAVAVIVCSGVAFAIAHATDSHPRVSSVQPPPRSVFLRAPYLVQPRTDSIIVDWLTPPSVTSGSVTYGSGGAETLTAEAVNRLHFPEADQPAE